MRSILDLKHTYYNGISLDQLNNLIENTIQLDSNTYPNNKQIKNYKNQLKKTFKQNKKVEKIYKKIEKLKSKSAKLRGIELWLALTRFQKNLGLIS